MRPDRARGETAAKAASRYQMTTLFIFLGLLLFPPVLWATLPHLDLDLRLDPASRQLSVHATLSGIKNPGSFLLDRRFNLQQIRTDGRRIEIPKASRGHGLNKYPLPSGSQVSMRYSGRLAPLVAYDHRQVLQGLPAMADPEGSFLPASSAWYPDPGGGFTYRIRLHLPAGQRGLVPGSLLSEKHGGKGYVAVYEFSKPAEGIDLMAGPYQVSERSLRLEDGRLVKVRTWFHVELASQADAYLNDSAAYIKRYSNLIGPYPFDMFSVVSAPLPTGFGMPSLTYMGRNVLRLPFIRATSLGHEVLHNWWGNGVYPDWAGGNWSEGLTTFMADYAYKEDQSPVAAREMRLGWLRDLAAVPEREETALRDFTSRQHGISSVIGYNKAAMIFLMLRDMIGEEAFTRGLKLFWQRHRFQTAGWLDLQQAFSESSGRDLAGFFSQWVDRPQSPRIELAHARTVADGLEVVIRQSDDYQIQVPLDLLVYPDRRIGHLVELSGRQTVVGLRADGLLQAVDLDPDYRIWRRVDKSKFPAILREVFVAPAVSLLVATSDPAMAVSAQELAARLAESPPRKLDETAQELPPEGATLIIGDATATILRRLGLVALPRELADRGTAQVWAGRDAKGRAYAVIAARDADSLRALARPLPHYGRQSWLVFQGARAEDKGIWAPLTERVRVPRAMTAPEAISSQAQ